MCTLKKLGKALLGVVQILNIMGTISSRPPLEQSCERLAWGTIPNEEKNPDIRQIYPNENAPSDHPPYVVSFTYSYIGAVTCVQITKSIYVAMTITTPLVEDAHVKNISAMSTMGKKNVIEDARLIALGVIPRSG